jgi:hypothetical protein
MPIRDKELEKSIRALAQIFKLRKTGGWGHFYFAGDAKGSNAGLVVTLASKDPKGMKAATLGKKIRKEIKGAKFAVGTVQLENKKYVFEINSGSASKSIIMAGFKKNLSLEKGLEFLKSRSLVRNAGSEKPAANVEKETPSKDGSEEIEFADLLGAVSLSEEELLDLTDAIPSLAEMTQTLSGVFGEPMLSDEELVRQEDERMAELINEGVQKCSGISTQLNELSGQLLLVEGAERDEILAQIAIVEERLQLERFELAEQLYVGDDPFPDPVSDLPPEIREVIGASVSDSIHLYSERLVKINQEVRSMLVDAEKNADDESWQKENSDRMLFETASQEAAINDFMAEIQNLLN